MDWEFWLNILPILVLLPLGYLVGRLRERSHLHSLAAREQEFADFIVCNTKKVLNPHGAQKVAMVSGTAVIASDYFKTFAAHLRGIVGGEVHAFETLMNRARREATLRMLEQAREMGAGEVWNVRLETSNICSSSRQKGMVSVEVFAFGTAVVR